MEILIADSGATKTDWAIVENGKPVFIKGAGLHPAYLSEDEIKEEINRTVGSQNPSFVRFFGAGCFQGDGRKRIRRALESQFGKVVSEIDDDLTGAAKGLLSKQNGIICALGTGSACGRYQNGKITNRSASLGFAIGDEGSAAHMGKLILKRYFRNQFRSDTTDIVKEALNSSDYSELMEKIYSGSSPAKKLGEIAGLILKDDLTTDLKDLVQESIASFFTEQFSALNPQQDEKVVFTGSISKSHSDIILQIFKEYGYSNTEIGGSVIEGLSIHFGGVK